MTVKPIYGYTRKQAVEDGLHIDASTTATKTGILLHGSAFPNIAS
jgi:type I site-specific restriction endonuclease